MNKRNIKVTSSGFRQSEERFYQGREKYSNLAEKDITKEEKEILHSGERYSTIVDQVDYDSTLVEKDIPPYRRKIPSRIHKVIPPQRRKMNFSTL